jgi:hypothetical protein
VRVLMPLLQTASLPVAGVILIDWSRTGAFITTAQRPGKGPDGQQAKNIKVRDVAAPSGSSSRPTAAAVDAGRGCLSGQSLAGKQQC